MTAVFSVRCYDAHEKMPYTWQARVNDQWTAMPNNEAVEKDYCDPVKTYRYSLQILKDVVFGGFCYKNKCDLKCK